MAVGQEFRRVFSELSKEEQERTAKNLFGQTASSVRAAAKA
jgi:hypothetical protein